MVTTPAQTAYDDQLRRRMAQAIRRYACWVTYVPDDVDCECCALEDTNREARRAREREHRRLRRSRASPPAFAYTTGLHGVGHPELVVFGEPQEPSRVILTALAHQVMDGADLIPGELVDTREVGGATFMVGTLPNPGRIVTHANWFYERPSFASVTALRLTRQSENLIHCEP